MRNKRNPNRHSNSPFRENLSWVVEEALLSGEYDKELNLIRSRSNLEGRIEEGAELLRKVILEKGFDETRVAPNLTLKNLSKIIFDDDSEVYILNLSRFLRREFGSTFNFQSRYFHYKVDYYEGLKKKGLDYTERDIIRQLRVPDKIGELEFLLYGIAVGDAFLANYKKEKHAYSVIFKGREGDIGFYKKLVPALLSHEFNILYLNTGVGDNKIISFNSRGAPIVVASSTLIYSWFVNILKFPKDKKHGFFTLKPRTEDERVYFLSGLLSSMLASKDNLVLNDKNKNLINFVKSILEEFGIETGDYIVDRDSGVNTYSLRISQEGKDIIYNTNLKLDKIDELNELYSLGIERRGLILNPRLFID